MQASRPHLEVLLGAADIARLAGVGGSAVVANWRTRFPNFPEPRIGGAQPRFEYREVLDWLRLDGPRGREVTEPEPAWLWPHLVEAYARQAAVGDLRTSQATPRAQVVALVAVARLMGGDPDWAAMAESADPIRTLHHLARMADKHAGVMAAERSRRWTHSFAEVLRSPPETGPYLVELAETLGALRDRPLAEVLEPILDLEPGTARLRPLRTRPALARLMVALGGVRTGDTVLDPAAGEGDVLVAASSIGGVKVEGQELEPEATFVAATRLLLEGATGGMSEPGDSVRDDRFAGRRFSAVLLDPPVSDRPSSDRVSHALTRWVEHALAHAEPGGRIVVVLPLHELAPVRAARRRPDQKLQRVLEATFATHALDAIVVLPRGLRSDVVGPLAVLALRAEAPGTDPDRSTVAVVALRARARELEHAPDRPDRPRLLENLIEALSGGDARRLREFHHPRIDHEVVPVAGVFDALEAMTEVVEQAAISRGPRRAPRTVDSLDALSSEEAEWALLPDSGLSTNSRRAFRLDPLTRESAPRVLLERRLGAEPLTTTDERSLQLARWLSESRRDGLEAVVDLVGKAAAALRHLEDAGSGDDDVRHLREMVEHVLARARSLADERSTPPR